MQGSPERFRRSNLGSGRQSGGFYALSDIEYENGPGLLFKLAEVGIGARII